jgi:hypothetical protein
LRHLRLLVVLSALAVGVASVSPAAGDTSQTIAAGTSATNLPTETVWPGSQNPPYICCWNQQGQYVTFAFSVGGGSTNLTLRYSAGSGVAYRKLELDGAVWVGKQTFPATPNWSTWTTLTLNTTLAAGAHTFKVWFDSTAGSARYINLDNLTVSADVPPPPAVVTVELGYADSAAGLSPWSGSPNTLFIGAPPQCCLTHGPDNGSPGYDGGAIAITNAGSSSMVLDAVTVDFGGGSSPSHFDLWSGGTAGKLPLSVAAGTHVVLTMTSNFNFDTSDLLGDACHPNTGVVAVVHVTVNGTTTDYNDSHQILNRDGTDLSMCPGSVGEQVSFTTVVPGDQPAAVPVYDVPPAVVGVPVQSRILSGFVGAWHASPPPSLSLQWTRCDSTGDNCTAVAGATSPTYRPGTDDVGATLRLEVTVSNPSGTVVRSSAATSVIQAGPAVSQLGNTSTGATAVFFTSSSSERGSIFTASEDGTTVDFEFFARGAGASQQLTPKVYSVVNNQKGSLLATGEAITVPKGADPAWYVSGLNGLPLTANTRYYLALSPTPVFNGTYVGAEWNGQLSVFVEYAPGAPAPPSNTALPTISGTPQQDQTLTATTGSWTGNPTSYTYQWQQCDSGGNNCNPLAQATNTTYQLTANDVGSTIRVAVTASNTAGPSSPATSTQTAVVQPAATPPVNTALPTITGTPQQNQTLTATTGSWTGNPTSYTYQWQQCNSTGAGCTNINGATAKTLKLNGGNVGKTIRVVVTARNGAGSSSATSAPTAVVQKR